MAKEDLWLVRDAKGRIYGPFTNERIHYLIMRAVFVGDEFVAVYPEGKFQSISKIPEFYDQLLEILQSEAEVISEAERTKELSQAQSLSSDRLLKDQVAEEGLTKTRNLPTSRVIREDPRKTTPVKPKRTLTEPRKQEEPKAEKPVVELHQAEAQKSSLNFRNIIFGGILVAAGAAIAFNLLLPKEKANKPAAKFISLLAPTVKRAAMTELEAKKRHAKAAQDFYLDSFEGYYKAQAALVEIIESGYQNIDAYTMLCLTHRELWPYSNQNSTDLLAISKTAQLASAKDPVGVSGATCRVVQQLLGGQYDGAASLTDTILNENPQAAVFYEFKAQVQTSKSDHTNAAAYLEKAIGLLPAWLKLKVSLAESYAKADRFNEASDLLREVVKQNTSHATAHVLLSEIEMFQFKRLREGVELSAAARSLGRMSKNIESRSWIVTAVGLERSQKIPEALEAARKAFQLDPTNLSAKEIMKKLGGADSMKELAIADRELVSLGEEYLKKGNYFAAQAEFKSAFELNSKNGRAAMLAGKSLWELNQSMDAIEWMKKAIEADPSLIQAHTSLADYYAQRYDFTSAYEMLQKIQRKDPQNYEVLGGFAQVELRRRNYKGASEMAKRALKVYDTDVATLILLARAQKGLNDIGGAFETMARVISLDSNSKEGHALYAEILGIQQGADLASKYLQDLINTYPQEILYRLALGQVLLRDGRLPAAIAQLQQAAAVNERSKEAYILLGQANLQNGEVRPALKAYLSAAALDPSDAYPVFLAGELYLSQKSYSQAKQQFELVIKINSSFPRANYMLGRTSLAAGDFDRALTLATLEKRSNPSLSDGYELAGDVKLARRDFKGAAQEFQRASQISPTVANILSLARAHRLSDNLEVAQALINRAIKAEDGNPEIYKEQGAVFEGQGARAEAVVSYRKYLDLVPNAPDRTVLENRIRGLGGQ